MLHETSYAYSSHHHHVGLFASQNIRGPDNANVDTSGTATVATACTYACLNASAQSDVSHIPTRPVKHDMDSTRQPSP